MIAAADIFFDLETRSSFSFVYTGGGGAVTPLTARWASRTGVAFLSK